MAALYYFNPDNDLALAAGCPHYTAPPRAEQLRRDLQLLPCWLAEPGSLVLCDDPSQQAWVDAQQLPVTLIGRKHLAALPDDTRLRPWGWSAALRWRLQHWGMPELLLPDAATIQRIRQLSHRRLTIDVHRLVNQALGRQLCLPPAEFDTLDQVTAYATLHPGCYVKQPWSGSGRGIVRAIDPSRRDFVERATGALQRQGSVLCEPALDRVADFAVELRCRHGQVHLLGYSAFTTDAHSQYRSGTVAPATTLRRAIERQYSALGQVEQALLQAIEQLVAPHYEGPLGVDMMLYRDDDGALAVDPCVEVNLRHTMGHVAVALDRLHHRRGTFAIKSPQQLTPADTPLTPITPATRLAAVLTDQPTSAAPTATGAANRQ